MRLELDDFLIDCDASNVLNDPVNAFIDLFAFSVAPASPEPRVCLWLEPSGYAIDVSAGASPTRCTLRIFFAADFVPPMRGQEMDLRFECKIDTGRFRAGLADGLSRLLESPNAVALDEWRRDMKLATYLARFRSLQRSSPTT